MDYSKKALSKVFHRDYSFKTINKDNIKAILIKDAYIDMQPRHFKDISEYKPQVENVFDQIAEEFIKYFKSDDMNRREFDHWHRDLCNKLTDLFHGIKPEYGTKMTAGKAQKVINITFKHLYLFPDVNENKFRHCHVVIDSYVIDWGLKNGVLVSSKKWNKTWSKLNYVEYIRLQCMFRKRLYQKERFRNQYMIAAEFYIWEEGKYDRKTRETTDALSFSATDINYYQIILEDPYIKRLFIKKYSESISSIRESLVHIEELLAQDQ